MFRKKSRHVTSESDLLGPARRVMSGSLRIDFDFEGFAKKNIFNKLSKSSDYGFYYWPYGYLFRHFRWGGVNSLGFRIDIELEEILENYNDHYRIGFFGGSTGYDVLVPGEQTLVKKLEDKLNACEDILAITGMPVKIFNLSQPGNLVMNQIMNYVQFGHLVKPNLVICHSAANDLCTMQMNDPALVSRYAIGYPDVLEAWGKKIHNAFDVEIDYQFSDSNSPEFKPAKDRVSPNALLDAYIFRVHQFAKLVRAQNDSDFIVGFQPWITSKKSNSEAEKVSRVSYNPYYQKIYKNVEYMYEKYSEQIVESFQPLPVANIHTHFGCLTSSATHFGDTHHLLGEGNEEAANVYFEKIRELLT